MAPLLTFDRALDALRQESDRFEDELGKVLATDPVPTCPLWSVRELVEHLGGVHRWVATIVERGLLRDDIPEVQQTGTPAESDGSDLRSWFRAGAARLLTALRQAPDDLQAFVLLKSDLSARHSWARRQAHETTIHRVDLLAARLGRVPSTGEADVATAVAVDGIDELVAGMVPRRRSRLRTSEPFRMVIAPSDADVAWTVDVSTEPPVTTPGAGPDPNAVLTGSAAALYLGLWNRGVDISEIGTVDALGHWREQVRIGWA